MPNSISADRNLLFGILALQVDLITRDALITALHAWALEKVKPLGQILVEQGALAPDSRALLDALVQKKVQLHDNDVQKGLVSLCQSHPLPEALKRIPDPELHASVAFLTAPPADVSDSNQTQAFTAEMPESPGLRYHILRKLAQGGLGEVFIAHDRELNREVALKELQDRHADHPESRIRFLLEAEITGGLEHPGVVPVYGLGQYTDGRPFYAMRLIRGHTLLGAIKRFHGAERPGRNPNERAREFRHLLGRFLDVCNAIDYAHSRGVLHRDLKPDNIMLGPYGETLVVDWGLAKLLDRPETPLDSREGPLQPSAASNVTPTRLGSRLGTPPYMSPEQAAGRLNDLGPASDIYSLGATLYCLLVGHPPFQEQNLEIVLRKVQRGEFSRPREINRLIPPTLEAICLKAMALNPLERYATPRALSDDIEQWLADVAVSAYRDIIFTIAIDGTITSLNPAFEMVIGWPRAEWLGRSYWDLLHPQDFPVAEELFQRISTGQSLPIIQLRIRTKSGDYILLECMAIVQSEGGMAVGVMGIGRVVPEKEQPRLPIGRDHRLR